MKRTVFYISDRTGITAEALGQALLTQFDELEFEETTIPFIDTKEKVIKAVEQINAASKRDGVRPIIFDTIVRPELRQLLKQADGMTLDFFHTFIGPLEDELDTKSSFSVGKVHALQDVHAYDHRIDAVNFSLNNDDGATTRNYKDADLIIIGVSRCGKTPTSLYLAMQFGLKVANYPFVAEDMDNLKLPHELAKHKGKLFGLTIFPERLHDIRTERRANSQYASLPQCKMEVRAVEALFRREKIAFLNATTRSIEEISTKILVKCNLGRHATGI
ncbi:MAG: phosphoenolpyruvate synthase regulatory protein [Gammaproteobacteria bacterium]|nr:MAG: phosphoenolpyruvate synthase regulatory protein [Gammaproteobacteria bacterium]